MFVNGRDPADFPTEHLEAEIATLYARISAETCEWLVLVAELERREAYLDVGCRTCAEWLSIHCGIGRRAAQEHVRVAKELEELPHIRDAFAHGELSFSKVRALTRIADESNERSLLDLARKGTGAQLERIVRAYRRAAPPAEEEAIGERRHATFRWDDDGSLVISACLPPEEGALLLKAFELAKEELWKERAEQARETEEGGTAAPQHRADATSADALARVAENALAGAAHDHSGADTHQLVVHVEVGGGRSEVDGFGLPPEAARRLGCDASVIASVERGGEVLSVGRKTRSIPPALRRALRERDGGCRFPGCNARRLVDGHHIVHWAEGGETSISNLVSLCRHHHRLVYEGGFKVTAGRGNRFVFRRPDGKVIPDCGRPPRIPRSALRRPPAKLNPEVRYFGAPIAPCGATCAGEKLDLDHTMFVLMRSPFL
jgi:hypothetical protein